MDWEELGVDFRPQQSNEELGLRATVQAAVVAGGRYFLFTGSKESFLVLCVMTTNPQCHVN